MGRGEEVGGHVSGASEGSRGVAEGEGEWGGRVDLVGLEWTLGRSAGLSYQNPLKPQPIKSISEMRHRMP